MAKGNRQETPARARILDAACQLFAEKGYRGATVAMICRRAEVNIAAVNYYFRSKEELYRQAWRHAHEQSMAQTPPDDGVGPDAPAEERLGGRIRAGLKRAILGDGVEHRIMRKEIANPTGLLHEVIRDSIGPLHRATQEILRELLGPTASDLDVELCETCVVSPWMHIMHRRQAKRHVGLPVFAEAMLEDAADHFTAYALAGIRGIRHRIERSGPGRVSRGKARRSRKGK